jgi:hypothetical protein
VAVPQGHAASRPPFPASTTLLAYRFGERSSIEVADTERVGAIVSELNAIRTHEWHSFTGKVGGCSLVVVLRQNARPVGTLYVQPNAVVELSQGKVRSGFIVHVRPTELRRVLQLGEEVGARAACRK